MAYPGNISVRLFRPTIPGYSFILVDGVSHCESKDSCPRTQQNDPSNGLNTMKTGYHIPPQMYKLKKQQQQQQQLTGKQYFFQIQVGYENNAGKNHASFYT